MTAELWTTREPHPATQNPDHIDDRDVAGHVPADLRGQGADLRRILNATTIETGSYL